MSNGNSVLRIIFRVFIAILLSVLSFFVWMFIVSCIPILWMSPFGLILGILITLVVFLKCLFFKPKYKQKFDYPEKKLEEKVYTEKKQRNLVDFWDKGMNWIRGNKVTAAMAMSLIVISIVLISAVNSANPSPKSIAREYVKQCEKEYPGNKFRLDQIEYDGDDLAYITVQYKEGNKKVWIDYSYTLRVVKNLGKWQADNY